MSQIALTNDLIILLVLIFGGWCLSQVIGWVREGWRSWRDAAGTEIERNDDSWTN